MLSGFPLAPSLSLSSVQKGFTMGMVCEGEEEGQEIPPGSQVLDRDVWWTLLLDCMPEAILTRVHSPANAERHNNLVAKVCGVSACWMPFHLKLARLGCSYPVGCVVKMNSSKLRKWIGQLSGPNIIDLLLHFEQPLVQVHSD